MHVVCDDVELEDDGQSDDDPSSLAKWSSKKRHSTEERLARLQADKRIKTIEKHRAQCGICDKWVKLQNKTEYDPHNWFAHIKKCEIRAKWVFSLSKLTGFISHFSTNLGYLLPRLLSQLYSPLYNGVLHRLLRKKHLPRMIRIVFRVQ